MKSTKVFLLAVFVLILVCINPSTAAVPVAQFRGTPITGSAPLTVTFTDQSTGSPTGWAWYFGDETYIAPWTQVNASAGWMARGDHTSVVLPDGSIVLMGGYGGLLLNDVWRSIDKGTTWIEMNASAGWTGREYHSSVALPDGSIVLMGGYDGRGSSGYYNDTWRSTDKGATWTLMTAHAGWTARALQSSVALPDGSIVLMGGAGTDGGIRNDTWRSTDKGATWTLMTAHADWTARTLHRSVVMPDGSIVLMGGSYTNDVWRSTDKGATWTEMNASAGWTPRTRHSSVTMPDGSIVLMGGAEGDKNDTWRSTNNGTTWTQLTANAGWSARYSHTSVVMPDGSIVLMGGVHGGYFQNDVWQLMTNGSSMQNSSHTYTVPGIYSVALQAYNVDGYNSTRKIGYVTVTSPPALTANFNVNTSSGISPQAVAFTDMSTGIGISAWNWSFGDGTWENRTSSTNPIHVYTAGTWHPTLTITNTSASNTSLITPSRTITVIPASTPTITKVGVYNDGAWYLDWSGNGAWDGSDRAYSFGAHGWTPIVGDWNATGKSYIGVTNGQQWYLDWNGNGIWDGADKVYSFGAPGWTNVTGDWNHDGKTEIGVTNGQQWYLDMNGNGAWDNGVDAMYNFGAMGWTPVVGDWNATGFTYIGVTNGQQWYLDMNGNGAWDGADKAYNFGAPGWKPIVGDWNATGKSNIGVTNGQQWYLDWNGNGAWDGADRAYSFGAPGWTPLVGDWNGDGKTKIGVTNSQQWYLDTNGNGAWDNGVDYAYSFGALGWIPIVGKWN